MVQTTACAYITRVFDPPTGSILFQQTYNSQFSRRIDLIDWVDESHRLSRLHTRDLRTAGHIGETSFYREITRINKEDPSVLITLDSVDTTKATPETLYATVTIYGDGSHDMTVFRSALERTAELVRRLILLNVTGYDMSSTDEALIEALEGTLNDGRSPGNEPVRVIMEDLDFIDGAWANAGLV